MASERSPLDISNLPELAPLMDEGERTGRPRVLARNNRPIAMLVPTAPAKSASRLRPPRDVLAVVGRPAGMFRHAAKHPPATIADEKAAFERGVADEVMHGTGG